MFLIQAIQTKIESRWQLRGFKLDIPHSQETHYSEHLWMLTVPGPSKAASTLSRSEHCTSGGTAHVRGKRKMENGKFGKCSKNQVFSLRQPIKTAFLVFKDNCKEKDSQFLSFCACSVRGEKPTKQTKQPPLL